MQDSRSTHGLYCVEVLNRTKAVRATNDYMMPASREEQMFRNPIHQQVMRNTSNTTSIFTTTTTTTTTLEQQHSPCLTHQHIVSRHMSQTVRSGSSEPLSVCHGLLDNTWDQRGLDTKSRRDYKLSKSFPVTRRPTDIDIPTQVFHRRTSSELTLSQDETSYDSDTDSTRDSQGNQTVEVTTCPHPPRVSNKSHSFHARTTPMRLPVEKRETCSNAGSSGKPSMMVPTPPPRPFCRRSRSMLNLKARPTPLNYRGSQQPGRGSQSYVSHQVLPPLESRSPVSNRNGYRSNDIPETPRKHFVRKRHSKLARSASQINVLPKGEALNLSASTVPTGRENQNHHGNQSPSAFRAFRLLDANNGKEYPVVANLSQSNKGMSHTRRTANTPPTVASRKSETQSLSPLSLDEPNSLRLSRTRRNMGLMRLRSSPALVNTCESVELPNISVENTVPLGLKSFNLSSTSVSTTPAAKCEKVKGRIASEPVLHSKQVIGDSNMDTTASTSPCDWLNHPVHQWAHDDDDVIESDGSDLQVGRAPLQTFDSLDMLLQLTSPVGSSNLPSTPIELSDTPVATSPLPIPRKPKCSSPGRRPFVHATSVVDMSGVRLPRAQSLPFLHS